MMPADRERLWAGVTASVVSLWLGAALLVVTSVAPAAFATLPTRTLAGDLVGRVLSAVFVAGVIVGCGVAVSGPSGRARRLLGLVTALPCAISQFVVLPRIVNLRAAIGVPVETLMIDDARRILFGRLHLVSVACLGIAMLAAVALVFSSSIRSQLVFHA